MCQYAYYLYTHVSRTCTQLNKRVDRNYFYIILDTCHVPTNVILSTTYMAILRNALCPDDIIIIIMQISDF